MYQKYGSWILTGPGKDSLMKKRTVSWIMTAALGVGALTGSMCSANLVFAEEQTEEQNAESEEETEQTDTDDSVMKIGALKGPTAMGMAQLLDDENYEFSIVASPDEIVPMIVQGQVDIAAVPSNLASVLYQKTDQKHQRTGSEHTWSSLPCGERGFHSVCRGSEGQNHLRQRQRCYTRVCVNLCFGSQRTGS